MSRCDSAISYATEAHEAAFGDPLPEVPLLCCELEADHEGPHTAGGQTWLRYEALVP